MSMSSVGIFHILCHQLCLCSWPGSRAVLHGQNFNTEHYFDASQTSLDYVSLLLIVNYLFAAP